MDAFIIRIVVRKSVSNGRSVPKSPLWGIFAWNDGALFLISPKIRKRRKRWRGVGLVFVVGSFFLILKILKIIRKRARRMRKRSQRGQTMTENEMRPAYSKAGLISMF